MSESHLRKVKGRKLTEVPLTAEPRTTIWEGLCSLSLPWQSMQHGYRIAAQGGGGGGLENMSCFEIVLDHSEDTAEGNGSQIGSHPRYADEDKMDQVEWQCA